MRLPDTVNYDRSHEKAVKSVVQYLYHTSHLAIAYFRDGNEFSSEKNTATVWEAGCHPLDWNKNENERFKVLRMYRLETTLLHDGVLLGTYFFNGEPISWFSRLQKLVALSTAESEIYAATDAAKVVAHLKVYFMTCIVMGSQLGNYKTHDTL